MTYSKSKSVLFVVALASMALGACDGRRNRLSADPTFDVSSVSIKESGVLTDKGQNDYQGKSNYDLKEFKFEACMIDRVNRSPVLSADFSVSDGVTEQTMQSDPVTGCIVWTEKHRIDTISEERFVSVPRTFKATGAFEGSMTLMFGFNPKGDKIVDLRKVTPPNLDPQEMKLGFSSELTLANIGGKKGSQTVLVDKIDLTFQGLDRDATIINTLLTPKTAQKFLLEFSPLFLRTSLSDNTVQKVGVRGGKFRITFMIFPEREYVANKLTPDNLVAEFAVTAEALSSGEVKQDVALRIHDMAAALSRNMAIVTIEPLEELARFGKAQVFYGQVDPLLGNSVSVSLRPRLDADTNMMTALDASLERANKSETGFAYLQASGLKAAAMTPTIQASLTGGKFLAFAPTTLKDLKSYCSLFYTDDIRVPRKVVGKWFGWTKPSLATCLKDPNSALSMSARDFVEKVNKVSYVGRPDTREITISSSKSISWNASSTLSESASIDASLSAGAGIGTPDGFLKGLSPVKASASADVNAKVGAGWSLSRARTSESSMSASSSQSDALKVDSDVYRLNVTVKRCALIKPALEGVSGGAYVCLPQSITKQVDETYYLVNYKRESSPLIDGDSLMDASNWRILIRGEQSFKAFESMLVDKNSSLSIKKFALSLTGPNLNRPLLQDMKVTQEIPGALLPAQ